MTTAQEGAESLPPPVTPAKLKVTVRVTTDSWSSIEIASASVLTTLDSFQDDTDLLAELVLTGVKTAQQRYLDALTDHNRRAAAGEYDAPASDTPS